MKKQTTLSLTQTALMTALIAVSAQLALPFFAIPLTLQTFTVCFQGSLGILLGPTGGFLLGFLPLAFFCGIAKKSNLPSVMFPLIGLAICHLFGVLWFSWQSGNGMLSAFLLSSAPYIIKDILSCIAARLLAKRLLRVTKSKIFNKN